MRLHSAWYGQSEQRCPCLHGHIKGESSRPDTWTESIDLANLSGKGNPESDAASVVTNSTVGKGSSSDLLTGVNGCYIFPQVKIQYSRQTPEPLKADVANALLSADQLSDQMKHKPTQWHGVTPFELKDFCLEFGSGPGGPDTLIQCFVDALDIAITWNAV